MIIWKINSKISVLIFTVNKFCVKIYKEEGIFIKIRKIAYIVISILLICIGAWFLHDTERRSEPVPDNSLVQEENKKPADNSQNSNEEFLNDSDKAQMPSLDTKEAFELKKEAEYVQLRLSITSDEGQMQAVEDYLKKKLNVGVKEDYVGNTYFSLPRENYNLALNAIIDCPHTENVVYKNEDYYPVACEIYNKAASDGKLPREAIEYIENIESMCKEIIITVN